MKKALLTLRFEIWKRIFYFRMWRIARKLF